ncbi:YicC family protein [soil metagenome]
MPLCSMTGFARIDGGGNGYRWTWELRSVNGKGLDVRVRVPPGFDALEIAVRERIAARLTRGNIQAGLTADHRAGTQRIRINEDALAEVVSAMERIGKRLTLQPPTLDSILAVCGVVENGEAEPDEAQRAALATAMLTDLDRAVTAIHADRSREGSAIGAVLAGRLDEIGRLTGAAEASPARTPAAIRARLAEQIALLLDAAPALDPDRLHQEAVLLATKADIREELDRLGAHVDAARALLEEGGPVGRRLDFLAQEFNREVNTLCSKSNDRSLTAIGLDLKAVVDQLREQIQNLE